jgi:hypothetical protein
MSEQQHERLLDIANQALLKDYLGRDELAQELRTSVRTLDRWHTRRIGPPRTVIGRTVLYSIESVRSWLQSREQRQQRRG